MRIAFRWFAFGLLGLCCLATAAKEKKNGWVTIQNGQLWKTQEGEVVQAHAPGFVRVNGLWYMCGEDRSRSWNPDVNLYSSPDLVHWTFERKIIQNRVTTPELGKTRMIERPKLLYNAQTGKYVVWCHYESSNYGASEAACFECDSVNGAYRFVWGGRPLGIKSRDCNVFQAKDGTAYFISTTEENQHLGLFRLSEDYREAVEHTQLFPRQGREAPAIVQVGDTYFMFSSACTGWAPNPCKLSYSKDLKEGWTPLELVGNNIAYDTQAAAILEVKGSKATTYLYVGDRWQDPDLPQSKTILFPISFRGTQCDFTYRERFDINFETGEWRETPVQGLFVDKRRWSTLQHDKALDMGKVLRIKGFVTREGLHRHGRDVVRNYQFQVSTDGKAWTTVSEGKWLPYCAEVDFPAVKCRYIRLLSPDGRFASLDDIEVIRD